MSEIKIKIEIEDKFDFKIPIQDPWYSFIVKYPYIKKFEVKKQSETWNFLKKKMEGLITCDDKKTKVRITKIEKYDTLEECFEHETFQRCLPEIRTIEEAKNIYADFQIDSIQKQNMNEEELRLARIDAINLINSIGVQVIYLEILD